MLDFWAGCQCINIGVNDILRDCGSCDVDQFLDRNAVYSSVKNSVSTVGMCDDCGWLSKTFINEPDRFLEFLQCCRLPLRLTMCGSVETNNKITCLYQRFYKS